MNPKKHWLDDQEVSLKEAACMMAGVLQEIRKDVLFMLEFDDVKARDLCFDLLDLIGDSFLAYEKALKDENKNSQKIGVVKRCSALFIKIIRYKIILSKIIRYKIIR